MNKITALFSLFLLWSLVTFSAALGQGVTTSSLTGIVTDDTGETLPGATVVAVHEPSGTSYGAATRNDGSYRLSNMRVGGPYTVTFRFVGFHPYVVENLYLSLGETHNQSARLSSDTIEMEELIVLGLEDQIFNRERTGASTNITSERITAIPTISRSINDLTRLTPQSSGTRTSSEPGSVTMKSVWMTPSPGQSAPLWVDPSSETVSSFL